ncbi:DEAD-box helicase Dbp80-like [Homarus americanus]|uniref:RNA helicase n=1 Tax=Homarus americanus TaxID=6706 RepID=A0A8J5JZ21_HOMAM|nr:DEAD-box helicase Dbp80-like [Homarus americanus]KAG7167252.1 ATP-dependent RNA helicase DDX19A-like [Homarus americanus]
MGDDWAKAAEEQEAKDLVDKVCNLKLPQTEEDGVSPEKQTAPNEVSPEESVTAADLSLMRKAMRKGIVECKNNVEVYRKDPKNPLFCVKTFEELNLRKELLEGIYDMGFKLPSKIQEISLPTLLADPPANMIAQSQSGTGKTAAFTLAMLSRIDSSKKCCQALCLSPTMELALQTLDCVKQMGKKCTDITIRSAVKGNSVPRGQKIMEHIVIGTPGKVVDWVTKYKCLDLRLCKVFVLDEADVMIATQGHQDQSVRIHKQLPEKCQMMLFSATYDDEVVNFAEAIITDPVVLRLRREEETLTNIRQMYVECRSQDEKYEAISNIYSIPVGSAMFFCHTKQNANWLATRLKEDGHQVALLTGDLTPDERVRVLLRFREGSERVLICTNVLARGIDVDTVNLVVNYDLPHVYGSGKADCETYLHRIGRTGRFGKTGNAINIVDGQDDLRLLREIEQHFNIKIVKLDYNNIDEIEKLGED